jgi:hypothetical protein
VRLEEEGGGEEPHRDETFRIVQVGVGVVFYGVQNLAAAGSDEIPEEPVLNHDFVAVRI